LKALAAEYATPLNLPQEAVSAMNSALCRFLPPGALFTLAYARLNRQTGRMSLVNAGHPPAIVVHANGNEPVIVRQEGDVVGAFADAGFGATELNLRPGDRIFFYTDGLIETGGSYEQGLQRLAGACFSHRALPLSDLVPAVAEEVMSGLSAVDDTLLMGVER
jgi:sigma-B regulation protein RsbU (phosphoserine phosphatase)